MNLETMADYAKIKGLNVLGTGDFTHPLWFKELATKLEEAETGLFKLRKNFKKLSLNNFFGDSPELEDREIRFILSTEVNCVYFKHNAEKHVKMLIMAPDLETVEKINIHLGWIGNLQADGRPTFSVDIKEIVRIVSKISKKCLFVPTDVWSPRGGLFGYHFGFQSISRCFDEMSDQIQAVEIGSSGDCQMCQNFSGLSGLSLIAVSGAKEPEQIGLQASIFDGRRLDYMAIVQAIKKGRQEKRTSLNLEKVFQSFAQSGSYFASGHKNCQIKMEADEIFQHKGICPKCQKPLKIGSSYQAARLKDVESKQTNEDKKLFSYVIPLLVLIELAGAKKDTRANKKQYKELIEKFGTEYNILHQTPISSIERISSPQIALAIKKMRAGEVKIDPGYDGRPGRYQFFQNGEEKNLEKQKSLF